MGWLEDFVEHTKYGEPPPKIMKWVGVSTIAGALRRKVWIDEFNFQWTPNFYILLIGPPGVLKKSTSIGLGMRMLKQVPDIDFGPQIITWEQLISHMAESRQVYKVDGKDFEASCVTMELSEFGTLFDPQNRSMVDNLTDIWDAKLGTIAKETKTNGCDEVTNPWLNICACTTPGWLDDNFSGKFIRSGFASRVIYVFCDKPGRVAHPSRHMPKGMKEQENSLVARLKEIAKYAGAYKLSEEAYAWSEKWYDNFRNLLEGSYNKDEMSLHSRGQTHLMKLAMILSASKGKFPDIGVEELEEADQMLREVEEDIGQVFGNVGQTPVSKLGKDILEVLTREGKKTKKELYRKHFFRVVGIKPFDEALEGVKQAGLVKEAGDLRDPLLMVC